MCLSGSLALLMPVHLCFAIVFVIFAYPLEALYGKRSLWALDAVLVLLTVSAGIYFVQNAGSLTGNADQSITPDTPGLVATVFILIAILEAVRRVAGIEFFLILLLFFVYAFAGRIMPGILKAPGVQPVELLETLGLSGGGIFEMPLKVSAKLLFFFPVLGALFDLCGADDLLSVFSIRISKKLKGGAGKAAVISSGLMGLFSGSAEANVSQTGKYTIPLMKKSGYLPEEAGAIEASASLGGQLLPPVMGAGAFIMAEITGISYLRIAGAALIPGIAWFLSIYVFVHIFSKKNNIGNINETAQRYDISFKDAVRLIPFGLLPVLFCAGCGLPVSLVVCIAVSCALCFIIKTGRPSKKEFMEKIFKGISQSAYFAVTTAACGIMMGIMLETGLADRISGILKRAGQLGLVYALILAAVTVLILGMPLPAVAAYLVSSALFAGVIKMLLDFKEITAGTDTVLIANLFIFCFAIVSQITPPVCQTSLSASEIAGSDPVKTSRLACFFAFAAFVIPFVIVLCPPVVLEGGAAGIAAAFCGMILGAAVLGGLAAFLYLSFSGKKISRGDDDEG
ncbi:MAG: TRAP transporter fused permease subunit [Lachnospiraceae bacterium]|nr:TRAP transporter fused permease subunit [Lachnospiraceae bacterium]